MDSASAEAVRRVAASIRQDGGPSLSLVFVRTLNGELPTEFAKRAYLEWRPGRPERDDGIVCVAAVEERGVACEIGAAVERSVTRDWITNFARERLLPAIGTDRLGPAAVEFTQNVLAAVGGRPALVAEPYRTRVDRTALWAAVGLLAPLAARFAWALVVIVTEAARENRRRKRGGSPRPPLEATPTFVRVELRAAQETPVLQSTIVDPRILVAPLLLVGVFAFALWSRWSDGVERVACSRVSGACVLQHDGDAPLSMRDRFSSPTRASS